MRLAILMLAAALSAYGATTKNATFSYDFTGGIVCSGSVTVNCFDRFEVGVFSGGLFQSLAVIPIPPGASGVVNNITGDFSVTGVGTMTFACIMVMKDAGGARVTSDPLLATATSSVRPGPPTGLVIK